MSNMLVVKDKVQRFSKEMFGVVNLDDDGGLIIPYESTRIFIDVNDRIFENKEFQIENNLSTTVVNVWSPVLRNFKPSPPMFEWVATEGQAYLYGHFKLLTNDEGKWLLIFEVTIPGDTLDPGELKEALLSVAITADDEDDKLKARFGGLRAVDE